MDATTATALVVACAESSLPSRAEDLLALAEKLGATADRCGVPKKALVDKLSRADDAGRLDAVLELRGAAAAIREAAATLARACDGFAHLVGAIGAVRASAEAEAARPRGCAGRIKAWWNKWRQGRSGRVREDLEAAAPFLARDLSASLSHKGAAVADLPAAGQESDGRSEKIAGCSAMQGCALLASLTVLPYMGTDGVLKTGTYSSLYRQYAGAAFSSIWCLVGVGVPCLYTRSRILQFYTRLASRIGMLAATLLVIFYSHWLLFPDSAVLLWGLVIGSVFLHFGIFLWACFDGDM